MILDPGASMKAVPVTINPKPGQPPSGPDTQLLTSPIRCDQTPNRTNGDGEIGHDVVESDERFVTAHPGQHRVGSAGREGLAAVTQSPGP